MSDFSNSRPGSSKGWIIGAIAVVLVVLFIVFSGGSAPPSGENTAVPDASLPASTPSETAPAAVAPPAANVTE